MTTKKIYGIDLGTSVSLLAIHTDDDILKILKRVSSVVNTSTGEVGDNVKNKIKEGKKVTAVLNFKTDTGSTSIGDAVEKASELVLKSLVEGLEKPVHAVITVPAYFSTKQRESVKRSAIKAGIEVEFILNEPVAASRYHSYINNLTYEQTLVFDLGGGTFDVSIVTNSRAVSSVLATNGIILGGKDLDAEVAKLLEDKIKISVLNKTSEFKSAMRLIAADAKHKIQRQMSDISVTVPSNICKTMSDITVTLTEDEYKSLVSSVFSPAMRLTKELIDSQGITEYSTLLVGGSCLDPYLQDIVKSYFKDPQVVKDTDNSVALGASVVANAITHGIRMSTLTDVTSEGIGVADNDGAIDTIIAKNTTVPCTASRLYMPAKSGTITIKLLSIKDDECKQLEEMGVITLEADEDEALFINLKITAEGIAVFTVAKALEEPTVMSVKYA